MKEMIYCKNEKREILATGYCFGLLYYILNLGLHPTAYIKIPSNCNINECDIYVHGGVTYSDNFLWVSKNKKIDGHFIGWAYGHFGDYGGYEELLPKELRTGGKKWTTKEIFEEVRDACYQIKSIVTKEQFKSREYKIKEVKNGKD